MRDTRVQCPRCTIEYDSSLPPALVREFGRCVLCGWRLWVAGDERDLAMLVARSEPEPDIRRLVHGRQAALN